jgi:hypothetical protein
MAACTLGKPPQLWKTYDQFLSKPPEERTKLCIRDMMGCADEVLFLISTALRLEHLTKSGGLSDVQWEEWAVKIDQQLLELYPSRFLPTAAAPACANQDEAMSTSMEDSYPSPPSEPIVLDSGQDTSITLVSSVSRLPHEAITASFVLTTRIHVWSMKLGFHPHKDFFRSLLKELIRVISEIPSGLMGCDRLIMWPLLVGGSLAEAQDDRAFFVNRVPHLEPYGVMTTVEKIFREVWRVRDDSKQRFGKGAREVHWRDVMKKMKCEVLMI